MNFKQPDNGLYATVLGGNQIQFSINTYGEASFEQDHLLVTLEDANDSSKKVTIDLNINTSNPDSILKNN